jgi:predicted regulator of Ras-like GTPase activity (Roadblock/LC7/MglB family)
MFEAFKRLFSKPASPPDAAAPVKVEPVVAPVSAAVAHAPLIPSPPIRTGEALTLPLNEILSRLPDGLTHLILTRPGGIISFPIELVREQLRTGAVRVSFAQLRQSSPPGTFAENPSHDDSLIDLPLPLILAAVGSGGLARRPDQKRVEVSSEVKGVFGGGHSPSVRVVPASVAPGAPAAAPLRTPIVMKAVTPGALALAPAPAKPTTSIVPGPAASKPPASAPLPFSAPRTASPLPFATARPSPPLAAPAAASAPTGETVVTTIEVVSGAWPEPVRLEIQQFNLRNATISIPLNRLEAGMKAGRVIFTWAELCGWLSVPMTSPANGESEVEMPLKVIAPLFLARHHVTIPRKTVTIGENVPDLFSGLGRPVAQPPAPAPPAAPAVSAQEPATVGGANVLGEIFGKPSQTDWMPKEIMLQILAMPGVAGGVLGAADGLLVAGRTPAPLNAETLAAFLPQIFARVSGCAEEAQLGTLRALTLTAGVAPCAIFKAGPLYLAVLGRPGQALPEAALQRIAGELATLNH